VPRRAPQSRGNNQPDPKQLDLIRKLEKRNKIKRLQGNQEANAKEGLEKGSNMHWSGANSGRKPKEAEHQQPASVGAPWPWRHLKDHAPWTSCAITQAKNGGIGSF
jgi:hypothetical protein